MTNFQVYKKTLSFSLVGFLVDLLSLLLFAGCIIGGFFIGNAINDKGIIGLVVGLLVGIVALVLIKLFVSNVLKAGQIAMMTQGVTEGKLPDNVLHEGRKAVKERFASITAFFLVTRLIKGAFRQIGRTINKIGTSVGGDTGNAITSAIDTGIQILVGFLCDCCLGWVFYRKNVKTSTAACEGAAIFFRNGKTLIRNIGRIFGMGFIFLVIIGGGLFGIFYGISTMFPNLYNSLSKELIETFTRIEYNYESWMVDPKNLMLIVSGVFAIMLWAMIHNVFIRPFILTGVLKNFTAAGIKNMPTEEDFATLNKKSTKFAKLSAVNS